LRRAHQSLSAWSAALIPQVGTAQERLWPTLQESAAIAP
jgi:hypothetical protein